MSLYPDIDPSNRWPEEWWDDEDPENGQGMDDIPAAVPLCFDEAQPDDPTF